MTTASDIVSDRDLVTAQPPLAAFNYTDLGNAERLVARHGDDLRYCPARGWLIWDGRRWRDDDAGDVVQRTGETLRTLHAEALTIDDRDAREQLAKHALASEREARIRAAVTLAATDPKIVVRADDLDADPDLLNVRNGTLHLPSGELRPHLRGDLLSKLAPVEYHADAVAPTWAAFLERVTDGRADLAAFLQRAVGYSLSGRPKEQVAILLYGSGHNGKTTFVEAAQDLLGDKQYAENCPAATFLERREGIPSDIAMLRGARFVSAVEMPDGRRLNETLIKRLTGSDTISARFLHREWFSFRPVFVPWIATNHRPVIRGTDHAIWRRIRLVPFDVEIPPQERDRDLPDKLRGELPGILRWAVEGYAAYQAEGLEPPESVVHATATYRADMDLVGGFLDECCLVRDDVKAKPADLHRAFVEHAGRDVGMSSRAFYMELSRRGFERVKNNAGRWYVGVGLLVDGEPIFGANSQPDHDG